MGEKTAQKYAPRPPRGGAQLPLGNHPANTGGKPGRSGRKPDEFKALCAALASGDMTIAQVEAILGDAKHPAFVAALKWATENGYGKPKETVEQTGAVEVLVRFIEEPLS